MAKVNVTNFMANIDGDSWIHNLDPRTKVAIIMFFSSIPLLFTDFRFISFFIILTLPLWLTAKLNFRPMVGPLSGVLVIMIIIFLFNTVRGTAELTNPDPLSAFTWYIKLGPIVITSHTVVRGLFLALRLAVPFTIGLLVIATTDPTYLAKGLRKLRIPIDIVFMVLAALRFIPIVTEQLFNILDAQTIRGIGNSRIAKTRYLILPLFITSLRRTRVMGLATEAKGFGARLWCDFYETFKMHLADKILLIVLVLLTIASLYARFILNLGMLAVGQAK